MIEGTIAILRAREQERLAVIGVLASCFCDDLALAVSRLENCRDSAQEFEKAQPRGARRQRQLARDIRAVADDLLPPLRQLRDRGNV